MFKVNIMQRPRLNFYSTYRVAMFFSAASLAGAFSGLLAAAILKMDGIQGKPGWAWIFLLVNRIQTMFNFGYIV